MSKRECSKQLVQSCPELLEGKAAHGLPRFAGRYPCLTTRAYGTVREDGKASTCLRVAAFSLRSYFGEGRERPWRLISTFSLSIIVFWEE